MMVIEGNHEIEPQVAGITFQSYRTRFAVPSEESGSKSNFYYSFDAGGVHFVMLGAYVDYNATGNLYLSLLFIDNSVVASTITSYDIADLDTIWDTKNYWWRFSMREVLFQLQRIPNISLLFCLLPFRCSVCLAGERSSSSGPHRDPMASSRMAPTLVQ